MPSSIDKLRKFLKLESENRYENRAVIGGLEKIIPNWEKEARAEQVDSDLIERILVFLSSYPQMDASQRQTDLHALLADLPESTPVHPAAPQPRAPRPEPDLPPATDYPARGYEDRPARPRSQSTPRPPQGEREKVGLQAPLTVINGVGPKSAETLSALDLYTLEDLLYFFPRRYDDYSQLKPINRVQYGEDLTVIGAIHSISMRPFRGGSGSIIEAALTDGTAFLRLTWFNQPWLMNKLREGVQISVSGKVDIYLGRLMMNNPDWEFLEQDHLHTNRIVPVYRLTARVKQNWLRRQMYATVKFWAPRVSDYMPNRILQEAGLVNLPTALQQIHFPDSQDGLKKARSRISFDEIFLLQLGVLRQKRAWQSESARCFTVDDSWLEQQTNALPYVLTGAQQRAIAEIRGDLASGRPMNRLLQGDVGSGKTVVAALAAAVVASGGAQSAVLAPTSILAEQHFRSFSRLLTGAGEQPGVLAPGEIALLVGDTPEAEKRVIRDGLASGAIRLVIGTHALLEDPVTFQALQLAVIDEQHRFGVAQRAALRAKGENPHLLVMTATPIPRSLALTVYGDLDLTVMDEMPAGRQPIETHVLAPLERERAYTLIRSQIELGHQAFIIYPLVEQGEDGDGEGKAAVEERDRLQKDIFPQYSIGLLHGRMKPEEKESVMSQFRDGAYHILVSTSVVEVGVDVPNATVMMVESANRFGLAQLHQFRGRVGRGQAQSYALLVSETEDAVENARLSAMAETNDGFVLAERDLEQRGPGDFLGTRQSGYAELRLANLMDVRLIEKARHHAQALFERDPDLSDPENQLLSEMVEHYWFQGKGDVS